MSNCSGLDLFGDIDLVSACMSVVDQPEVCSALELELFSKIKNLGDWSEISELSVSMLRDSEVILHDEFLQVEVISIIDFFDCAEVGLPAEKGCCVTVHCSFFAEIVGKRWGFMPGSSKISSINISCTSEMSEWGY